MAAVGHDDRLDVAEVAIEVANDELGRPLLGVVGEAAQVREHHRDVALLGAQAALDDEVGHRRIHGRVEGVLDLRLHRLHGALGLLELLRAVTHPGLEVIAIVLQRLIRRGEGFLALAQLGVQARRVEHLFGQLLLQSSDDRAREDEEAGPRRDVRVDVEGLAADRERLREQHHVDRDHERAEQGPQHRGAPPQEVAGQDDGQEVEVEEGELRRDQVVDDGRAQQRHEHEHVLEIRDEVALDPVQGRTLRSKGWTRARGRLSY